MDEEQRGEARETGEERGEEERGGKKLALGRARAQKYCISTLVVILCAYFFSMFPASLSRVKPQFIDKPTFRGLTLFGTAIPRSWGHLTPWCSPRRSSSCLSVRTPRIACRLSRRWRAFRRGAWSLLDSRRWGRGSSLQAVKRWATR